MHSINSLQYYIPGFLSLWYVQSYLFFPKFWRAGPCLSGWEKEKFHSRLWRRQWHPTPVLLPGKSHRGRSLEGCSPWGCEESDTTEWLHFHFHALEKEMATHSSVLAWRIPGTGESGGLPSMGSQSWTRLKRLSSFLWPNLWGESFITEMQWSYLQWSQTGNNPNVHQQVNGMENRSGIKRNKQLIHTTQINIKPL